jgi:hypothetical protein
MPWLLYHQEKSFQYPLKRRLGGPQNWSDVLEKRNISLPLLGFTPHIAKPCHYTDYTILAHRHSGDWKDIILHQFSLKKHHNVLGNEDIESS